MLMLDPPYIGLFGLSWSELSPWVFAGRGSIGPATNFFCHGQKRDYLSRASQRARGATKNQVLIVDYAPGAKSGI